MDYSVLKYKNVPYFCTVWNTHYTICTLNLVCCERPSIIVAFLLECTDLRYYICVCTSVSFHESYTFMTTQFEDSK
jgi:hypothetical protein